MTETIDSIEVVSIKFRNRGKMYYFDPRGLKLKEGEKVVVETAKGLELGGVAQANHLIRADRTVRPLRPVARRATEDDLRIEENCRRREREAYVIGRQKIAAHGLDMKLVDVECSFEGNKIIFFFSSDGRVDFRELVKDLAGVFRTRIELRQIGVRDEARMLGGLGICGRPFCCGTFMEDFAPVSTKMAKTQSMSLNPAKISGCCGRLMCCLRYEQPAYEELVKSVPKNGAFVETPDGYGNVTQVNVLRQTVKVRLDGDGGDAFRTYDAEDVAAVPGGRPRDGSAPPHVLVLKPKKPKQFETEEDDWVMPERLILSDEERQAARESAKRHSNRARREGQQSGRGQRQHPQQKPGEKQGQTGEKREGERSASHKSRSRNRNRGRKPQEGDGSVPRTAQEPKTQQEPKSAQNRDGCGQKTGKSRRHYRPRPKNGGDQKKGE